MLTSNKKNKQITGLLAAAVAMFAAGSAMAAAINPVSYDFGTDAGKTTVSNAGFTEITTGEAVIDDVADGVEISRTDTGEGGFENAGFVKTFNGLGGNETNDFTINTSVKLIDHDPDQIKLDRFGSISMFADTADNNGIANTGLTATLRGNDGGDDDMYIHSGIDNYDIAIGQSLGYEFAPDDEFQLQVDGSFDGDDNLDLDFSVSRNGGEAQTLSTTIDATDVPDGTYFGVAERFKDATVSEFDTYEVVPEPGSLALLLIGALPLITGRRRRR